MKRLLLGTVFAAAVSVSAQAAPIAGTAAVAIVGVSSSTASIGVGTTFTNTLLSVIGSGTGDLSGTAGTVVTITPLTATPGSAFSFTSAIGNFAGSVTPGGVGVTGPASNVVVDVFVLGTFTPLGALSTFTPGPMSVTFSFTQTGGPNSSVSGSFSLASPPVPPPPVPAPMSLALFGLGLAGLAVVLRRKA